MNSKTDLMQHQRAAVEKLLPIRIGALFMEMGTGKSRTVIEMVLRRQDKIDKAVWFCPVSLKETVRREIMKHTDTQPEQINLFGEKTNGANLPETFWHIVGIESVSGSARVAIAVRALITDNSMVIIDESSYIKGHRSKRSNRITWFSEFSRYRIILTGTPISQGVVDLYSQMRFLSPKILGYRSFYSFAANHLEYSEKYPGMIVRSHNQKLIASKIQPYVYQITKTECLDLPSKTYKRFYFSMNPDQRRLYDEVKTRMLDMICTDDITSYDIFRLFGALQQIVSGYLNDTDHKMTYITSNPRIDMMGSVISGIPKEDKIIVWAKYEMDIVNIKRMLVEEYPNDNAVLFYGKLSEQERIRSVDEFMNGARFFVATQSCGGHGLTLVNAHYVIFFDNEFKYANRLQAEDRCHRIGQTKNVHYIDMVCTPSIDDRIMDAIAKKGDAVETFKREVDKVKDKKNDLKKLIGAL